MSRSSRGGEGPEAGRVSVVIVSWNTRELLLDAIRSFFPLEIGGEVVVVDNASADGSAEAVERTFPGIRVIRNSANLGFAGGVNVGLRAAREPFVLLLNTDTLVRENAIERCVAYAREHPDVAVVGPKILNRDGSRQESCYRFPSLLNLVLSSTYLYKLFPRSAFFNRESYADMDPDRAREVDFVSGCAFLIRAEALEQIGLLDESFFMYSEEMDFCYRARLAGFGVHYAPVGSIVHFGGESSRLQSRRMFIEFRRSMLRFYRKHHGPVYAAAGRAMLALFLLLRLPYWAGRAIGASDRESARAQLGNYAAGLRFLLLGRSGETR